MQYKEFTKEAVENYVKCFGFDTVDDKALVQLVMMVETLVYNMLNNVFYITDALKVKTLKKQHFEAVLNIMKDVQMQSMRKQSGGSFTVLPSEYFGVDSGRYLADVSQHETNMFVDNVTRPAINIQLPIQTAGSAKCMVPDKKFLTGFIQNFQKDTKTDFKVSTDVADILMASINNNLDELLGAAKNVHKVKGLKKNALTMTLINATIKKSPHQFGHLVFVWKRKN